MIAKYIEQAFAEAEQPDGVELRSVAAAQYDLAKGTVSMVCNVHAYIEVPRRRNEHEEAQSIINALHAAIGNVSAIMPNVKPVVLHGSVGGYPTAAEE